MRLQGRDGRVMPILRVLVQPYRDVPPVLDVILWPVGQIEARDLGPFGAVLLYSLEDDLILLLGPRALVARCQEWKGRGQVSTRVVGGGGRKERLKRTWPQVVAPSLTALFVIPLVRHTRATSAHACSPCSSTSWREADILLRRPQDVGIRAPAADALRVGMWGALQKPLKPLGGVGADGRLVGRQGESDGRIEQGGGSRSRAASEGAAEPFSERKRFTPLPSSFQRWCGEGLIEFGVRGSLPWGRLLGGRRPRVAAEREEAGRPCGSYDDDAYAARLAAAACAAWRVTCWWWRG